MKIALLGAESTGKTWLAGAMAAALRQRGLRAVVVDEVLRQWCQREGRTPRPDEQMPIAREQERRVDAADAQADIVLADTTALMVAIYSAMLFKDGSLYRFALERQRGYDLTLVTGLDLPWVPDGLQRDGPHVREPVDALVRAALHDAGVAYRVVYGHGEARLAHALDAIESIARGQGTACPAGTFDAQNRRLELLCGNCGDAACERRLFAQCRAAPARSDP